MNTSTVLNAHPEVNDMLKALGMTCVTILNGDTPTKHRVNGVLLPGIRLGATCPSDVSTNSTSIKRAFAAVINELMGMNINVSRYGDDFAMFIANPGSKKECRFTAMIERFPTHAPTEGLDSGYETSWMVFNFVK
jgi:hypothetical protein